MYGTLRRVYFYLVGTTGSISEIRGNLIYGINPLPSGNVVWGILFNRYGGTIRILNNKLHSLRSFTSGTQGMYGFGSLSVASNVILDIYNNFWGGDFVHSGTGTPASIDVISFQDAPVGTTVNFNFNTVVLNNMTKQASDRITCIRMNPDVSSTFNMFNNIFVNYRDSSVSRAIYFGGNVVTFNSNFNNIYAPGVNASVGFFGTNLPTLTDWQTATSNGANSLSVEPQLVSFLDFHFVDTSTPLLGEGIAIPGIATDIDGETTRFNP